ncbi:MAG: type I-U CRISPR-associated protein Csb2 [Parvularculaceae bacterium]
MPALLLTIRFHDGRYHGAGDWPPSPARVFQALVAGAARWKVLPDDASAALAWLETLDAPIIAAPAARETKSFVNWVPNNDLDAVGGDLNRVSKIRAGKTIRPWLFDAKLPLIYAWNFAGEGDAVKHAGEICAVSNDLYQLGRGVDTAWAVGDVLTDGELTTRLADYAGAIHRPSKSIAGKTNVACPQQGSLDSLVKRHAAGEGRFKTQYAAAPTKKEPNGTKVSGQLFTQPPKPRFRQVAYDCPATLLLFDLSGPNAPWQLTKAVELVTLVRDRAAKRLSDALPGKKACVERIFIGGKDSAEADKAARIRIIPLPSIGFIHADRAIRRVLVEIPPACPLGAGDIEWAFSGLDLSDFVPETGEITTERPMLVTAGNESMLAHYGVAGEMTSRLWRTVTAAALPDSAKRRRIDPSRKKDEPKGGVERLAEGERAASAVHAALRHAGIIEPVSSIRVQREPFEARGARAEDFADKTRFSKHRRWHVEVEFLELLAGPIVIGDGRYLGLGLMAPVPEIFPDAFVFCIEAEKPIAVDQQPAFLRAVRRALMALDRDDNPAKGVTRLFSGHENDGSPARSGSHEHVFLAATTDEGFLSKLLVLSPTLADRRAKLDRSQRTRFSEVARQLEFIRAGELGVIRVTLAPSGLDELSLTKPSCLWISETDYIPTRHRKSKDDPSEWVVEDVLVECARRGLPRPHVELLSIEPGTKSKPHARLKLRFKTPTNGPILIGEGAHLGSGLFQACLD